MTNKEYNKKAINDVYKNAHLALQSISDILPSVNAPELKEEISNQYEGYDKLIGEVSSFMAENGFTPKDANVFQKSMMWGAIKMKTMMNNSKNTIAELMIKGTVNGINELHAMKNESKNLDPGVLDLVEKLLSLEEDYQQRLKKYL